MNADGIIQSEEQLPHLVRGFDFLGLNFYTQWRIRHAEKRRGLSFK